MVDFNKPLVTRAGDAARILCTDAIGDYPVVGLLGNTAVCRWRPDGTHTLSQYNLANVPTRTERYMNIWNTAGQMCRQYETLEKAFSGRGVYTPHAVLRLLYEDDTLVSTEIVSKKEILDVRK